MRQTHALNQEIRGAEEEPPKVKAYRMALQQLADLMWFAKFAFLELLYHPR